MPAKKGNRINLLPQEEFAGSSLGRLLAWLLGPFRIIVIITEMIVVVAFLSRFWLDAQASDLNDAIKQKKAVISAMAGTEREFRDTQNRLSIFSAMTTPQKPVTNLISQIGSNLPADISLTNLSATDTSIQIRGTSSSEGSIYQLLVNLKSSGNFSDVSLTSVDTDTENKVLLDFSIKLTPGKGGGK